MSPRQDQVTKLHPNSLPSELGFLFGSFPELEPGCGDAHVCSFTRADTSRAPACRCKLGSAPAAAAESEHPLQKPFCSHLVFVSQPLPLPPSRLCHWRRSCEGGIFVSGARSRCSPHLQPASPPGTRCGCRGDAYDVINRGKW